MWNNRLVLTALFILSNKASALPLNHPKFCPTASWDRNAITLANQSMIGSYPLSVFVSINNTIYVANRENSMILVWHEDAIHPTNLISGDFNDSSSLFVASNGDIYIDDGAVNGRVQKWQANTNTFDTLMNIDSACHGLFLDTNDMLYCSMSNHHQVVKRSLNDPHTTSTIIVAGTGSPGSTVNQLDDPWGIFVDVNFDFYVADCNNNRVQLFRYGEVNGITVAGSGSSNPTINLNRPTGIALDADGNLFIVDSGNNRIVASNVHGFRCLVGCDGEGSQANQLSAPISFSFDRSANMLVADARNNRVQKFLYLKESCDATTSSSTARPTTRSSSIRTSTVSSNSASIMTDQLQKNTVFHIIFVLMLMLF